MPPLESNEEILYTARKHWFLLAGETALLCILALLPALLLFVPEVLPVALLDRLNELVHFEGNATLLVLFLWTLELLVLFIVFFLLWTDYYLDVWLLTNHRIVDIEQCGLFNRAISSFRLDLIQDATVEVPGILATFIDFGTVKIRTASQETFEFKGVAHPNELKEGIMSEQHRVHEDGQRL